MTAADLFRRIVAALEAAGIPYMLTGSFASSFHGRPRSTQDIDLVSAPSQDQVRALIRGLPPSQYYADEGAALEALQQESHFNVIDLATGWKIDFICRKSRPFSRLEFERRIRTQLEGLPLFIATAEDVILAKLEWAKLGGSARQIEDVAGLLAVRGVDLDREYLERWVTDLARALKISADELLGLKPATEKTPPRSARLRKRLQQVEALPATDQRTVLKLVEALAEARRSAGPLTKAPAASWRNRKDRPEQPGFSFPQRP